MKNILKLVLQPRTLIFLVVLFLPCKPILAATFAADSCRCFVGNSSNPDSQVASGVSKETSCAIACATTSGITSYSYGNSEERKVIIPATNANGGKRCFCSPNAVSARTLFSTLSSIAVINSAVEVGYAYDAAGCDQACADKGYKSYCLGGINNFLNAVTKSPSSTSSTTGTPGAQISSEEVGGTLGAPSDIITCGRHGQNMCTLCDLIKGMNNIIHYLMKIAIGIALLAMSIGGVMYIISAGESGLAEQAKGTMKNAAIGFVIIFAGYLIINTTIEYIGSRKTTDGNGKVTSMFGITMNGWGSFECNGDPNR